MESINTESKNILICALTGSVLSGTWLAYKLNLFKFLTIINVNDEKKILLPSFLFLLSPFLVSFICNQYMLSQSPNILSQSPAPGIYVILSALVSGIILLTSNFINNKFQLKREEQQRIWQEKIEQQKWYREKIYDSYRKSIQILTDISQVEFEAESNYITPQDKFIKLNKLWSELNCEFDTIIIGYPVKDFEEYTNQINQLSKYVQENRLQARTIIKQIMENDSRIKG